jgi:hypothetical protein
MVVLRTIRDVEELYEHTSMKPLFSKFKIQLEIPIDSETERHSWQTQLNKYKNDCGCSTGAIFLSVTLVIMIVLAVFTAFNSPMTATIKLSLIGIPVVFFSALVGKILGLIIAHLKFRRVCGKLLERLKTTAAPIY